MRALKSCMVLVMVLGLSAMDAAPELRPPAEGSASQRVQGLWSQTRTILLADASAPLSDFQAVARGEPMIDTWTQFDASLPEAHGESRAVIKLLSDFYGRSDSAQSRRVDIRNDVRGNFAQRLGMVDHRLSH